MDGVIKYLMKKGWKAKGNHKNIHDTLGDTSLSFTTVHKWVTEFKHGRESQKDDPRSGSPKTATLLEIIEKVHSMVIAVHSKIVG